MTLVGIISDTHGLLREEAVQALRGVDQILHAGDVGKPEILAALRTIAPVTAIRGNVDTGEWALALPEETTVTIDGVVFTLIHDLKMLKPQTAHGAGAVISGHTHKPAIETRDAVLFMNPGSAGPRRFSLPVTLGFVTISDSAIGGARIEHLDAASQPVRAPKGTAV